jgi:hypothetical protein
MTDGVPRAAEPPAVARRMTLASRPRRPWLLVAAALLFALLSGLLWTKWRESRGRAEQLEAELRHVYAEAEALRSQATRAQQRVDEVERELRAAAARESKRAPAPRRAR